MFYPEAQIYVDQAWPDHKRMNTLAWVFRIIQRMAEASIAIQNVHPSCSVCYTTCGTIELTGFHIAAKPMSSYPWAAWATDCPPDGWIRNMFNLFLICAKWMQWTHCEVDLSEYCSTESNSFRNEICFLKGVGARSFPISPNQKQSFVWSWLGLCVNIWATCETDMMPKGRKFVCEI
jgi:hypothetical protein